MSSDPGADGPHLARARSRCYGLLAATYLVLPSADFLAMVARADARTDFTAASRGAPTESDERESLEAGLLLVEAFLEEAEDTKQDDLLIRLGVDRTRLLRGVKRGYGPPPPYESIYRGGEVVMGEAALGAKGFYSTHGYQPPQGCNEPPDYIGLELDFTRFLCEKEATAWDAAGQVGVSECQAAQRDFMLGHVVGWVPVFCAEMLAQAKEDFYRGIAQLTRAFVALDAEALRLRRVDQ